MKVNIKSGKEYYYENARNYSLLFKSVTGVDFTGASIINISRGIANYQVKKLMDPFVDEEYDTSESAVYNYEVIIPILLKMNSYLINKGN
ncbi:hypothetical protein RZE82_07145 [Mollicutes bacterium LVI A0039]|nr:hypothetical protein RZE82_07145 [Mollicutes bacterium LVI A0039]